MAAAAEKLKYGAGLGFRLWVDLEEWLPTSSSKRCW